MKKLVTLKRIMVTTALSASLLSITAMAQETKPVLPLAPAQTTQSESDLDVKMKYQMEIWTIEEIEQQDEYIRIHLGNNDTGMGLICNVKEDAFVIQQEDSAFLKISDLKEGMKVASLLENDSPMTMSLPPITSSMAGFVILDEKGGNVDLSIYDEELTNKTNSLKLNLNESTKIVDLKGSKKVFTEEDVKERECLVIYHASTRSIPAQTSPDLVLILSQEENETLEPALNPEENENETKQYTGIRETSESLGYTLQWNGTDQSVLLEQEGVKIEMKVDSTICSINGIMAQMETTPVLENSKMMITEEQKTILEKYSK